MPEVEVEMFNSPPIPTSSTSTRDPHPDMDGPPDGGLALVTELEAEIARQDERYGPFGGTMAVGRLRLGVAVLEDETREVLDAWADDRKTGDWSHTREEALQVAAVAMRLVRQIDAETAQPVVAAAPVAPVGGGS